MPKSKKARSQGPQRGDGAGSRGARKMHTFSRLSTASAPGNGNKGPTGKKTSVQHQRPIVPFRRTDRVLLVGEGDFSFARSLAMQHRCRDILATSYDSKETLYSKYPQAAKNVEDILGAFPGKDQNGPGKEEEEARKGHDHRRGPNVIFGVDARKLASPAGGGRDVRVGFPRRERARPAWQEAKQGPVPAAHGGPWDLICFNFPHVGGLSTDVNRQVRSNQELLVAFFKACVPLLSARPDAMDDDDDDDDDDEDDDWSSSEASESEMTSPDGKKYRTEPGQILVSMFEGEPYTLWNIKDLARHAGLRVVTSFRFPWASYQGYSHARTVGEIEGKHGGRGGWRGEDREARMYVFEVKQEDQGASTKHPQFSRMDYKGKSKKRSRNTSDSDDSD